MLQTRLQMTLHLTWSSRLRTFLLRQLLGFEVQLRVQKKKSTQQARFTIVTSRMGDNKNIIMFRDIP
jgi:hypothetical protein